jgi:hypothetical protein
MTLPLPGLIVLGVIAVICGAVGKALVVALLHLMSGRRWVRN